MVGGSNLNDKGWVMSAGDIVGWIVIVGVIIAVVVTLRGVPGPARDPRGEALLEAKEWNEEVSGRVGRASLVLRPEGQAETDVTEDVVSVLDALYNSMDWGSGLLEDYEIASAERLMRALGFTMGPAGLERPAHEKRPDTKQPGTQGEPTTTLQARFARARSRRCVGADPV